MEFHDILHGHIQFDQSNDIVDLLSELIDSPEIHRLRNMRQMNFDVPLIQELGRSRRLPHSIGVAHIALGLANRSALSHSETKILLAAAILHDAAIPPYGHLVESEFKSVSADFKHETRVKELIKGTINEQNKYMVIVPKKSLKVADILSKYDVDYRRVIDIICPPPGQQSPISAGIDIDNIDNVHRMAAMLGWPYAKENARALIDGIVLNRLGEMKFKPETQPALQKWLEFRQRIYTMIIAHPECIPYNALQTDLVRIAVSEKIIIPSYWWMSETVFEEVLRGHEKSKELANQLISGCEYQTVDYVWIKEFDSQKRLNNAEIVRSFINNVPLPLEHGYFVWNEKGLISRRIKIFGDGWDGGSFGQDSTSCIIALVKKSLGRPKWSKEQALQWRRDVTIEFSKLFEVQGFNVDFPETYSGEYLNRRNGELALDYY